jgi:hypothetical protein
VPNRYCVEAPIPGPGCKSQIGRIVHGNDAAALPASAALSMARNLPEPIAIGVAPAAGASILAGKRHNGLLDDLLGQSHSCRVGGLVDGTKSYGKSRMRLILGIIIGGALTIGGAYVADKTAASGPQPMVNWDVVGKNVNSLTGLARDGWKKITG